MGFEISDEFGEEIPYSLSDYLLQPVRLTASTFRAMVVKPKLKYWLVALLIGSAFTGLGLWMLFQKLEIDIVAGGSNIPEEALEAAKGMMNMFLKNPAIIYVEALISELFIQVVAAVILFVLVKLMSGEGGFSAALMVMGLKNIPSILSGILLAYVGFVMPPIRWEIDISSGSAAGLGGSMPRSLEIQQGALNMLVSLWTVTIIYMACRHGFRMGKGSSFIAAAVMWIVLNFTMLLSLI